MALTESGIRFKTEGEDALTRAIKTLDSSLKALDKATAKASSGFADLTAATKRAEKIGNLTDKLKIQNDNLAMMQEKLAKVTTEYGENSEQAKKVQSSIDKLSLSIKQNQQAIAGLNREEEESKKNTQENIVAKARAADAAGKAATAVADLRTKLEQEGDAAKKSAAAIEDSNRAVDRVDDVSRKAATSIVHLGNSLRDSGRHFDAFGEIATGALRRVGEIAVDVGIEIGRALFDVTKDLVFNGGDYEASLNRFAAVAGDSIAAAGKTLRDFDKLALQLGADTQFSAKQVMDALVEAAKAGIKPAELAAGGLEAVLNLAAAGELNLAKAAEITAKQLGAWSGVGIETTEIVNLLSQAANASTLNVEDLALGTYNAGGVARGAGLEYKEFVSSLALLSSYFSGGAEAGTAFKSFLQKITPSTKPAIAAFKELGLITAEGNNVFFDAQNNFAGMANVAAQLKKALEGLTEKDRTELLKGAFGTYGIQVAIALAEKGAEGLGEIEAAMDATGAATEQAAKKQKGFNFALETLKGSLETVGELISRFLNPALTTLMSNVLTPATNAVGKFFSTILDYPDAVKQVKTLSKNFKDVKKASGDALEAIPDRYARATAQSNLLNQTIKDLANSFKGIIPDGALVSFEKLLKASYDLAVKIFPDLQAGAASVKDTLYEMLDSALISMFDSLTETIITINQNWGAFVSGVQAARDAASGFLNLSGNLLSYLYESSQAGSTAHTWLAEFPAQIRPVIQGVGEAIGVFAGFGQSIADAFAGEGPGAGIFAGLQGAFESLKEPVGKFLSNSEAVKGALVGIGVVVAGVGIVAGIFAIGGALAALANPITLLIVGAGLLGAAWQTNFANIQGFTIAFGTNIILVLKTVGMALYPFGATFIEILKNIGLTLVNFGIGAGIVFMGVLNWIREVINFLTRLSEHKPLDKLVANAIKSLEEFWVALVKVLERIWKDMSKHGARIATEIINGIVNTLKQKANEVYNAMANLMGGTVTTAEDATETHSPSRVFARIGAGLVDGLIQGLQSNQATGAVSTLLGSVIATSQALLGQWIAMLAKFGLESWMWAQKALPLLKVQMLAWGNAIMSTVTAQLPNFVAKLSLWSLEAWRWLQLAMAPLQAQMLLFSTALQTWATTVILLNLKIGATQWAKAAYDWIPNELMPGIQPLWDMFLTDSILHMKRMEEEMFKSGKKVGKAIISGILEGIIQNKHKIVLLLIEVMTEAINAAKQELGIASPSKVFYTLGEQIMDGMSGGIAAGARSTAKVMTSAVDSLIPGFASVPVSFMPSMAATDIATAGLSETLSGLSASSMIASAGQGGSVQPPASGNQINNQRAINNSYSNQKNYSLTVNSPRESQGVVQDFYLLQVMEGGGA